MPTQQTDSPTRLTARHEFLGSLGIQTRVWAALMIRAMVTRYGRGNIGFVWVVVEPMILATGVMVIWSAIKPPYEHGVYIIALVLTGYLPLTLWRHMTQSCLLVMQRNAGLLYHRNVTLFDVALSNMMLELIGTTTALLVVASTLIALGIVEPPHDMGLMLVGWSIMAGLALGFGLNLAAATEYTEVAERFVQPLQYFLLPISGCFYMAEWVPDAARDYLVYVPHLHAYETFRAGFFGESVVTHYSFSYPGAWIVFMTASGMLFLKVVRGRCSVG